MDGYCECGCGQKTKIAHRTDKHQGMVKGQHMRFIRGHSGGKRGRTLSQRFWAMVRKSDRCWEWSGCLNNRGYGQFNIGGKAELAHRVSWEIANGSIPDGLNALHRCDNPCCVRPDHLFLGTLSDNSNDMVRKGRRTYPKGVIYANKLTETQVLEIRAFTPLAYGDIVKLANKHGVGANTIRDIRSRRTWRNLP